MLGPSKLKLTLTALGLTAGLGYLSLGVAAGQVEPVVMLGVLALGGPFALAWASASLERWQRGPVTIPSMPSAPASDAPPPRIPARGRANPPGLIPVRRMIGGRERRQIVVRPPY